MPFKIEKHESYLLVRMQWSKQRPGFDGLSFKELAAILREAENDKSLFSVVLTGSERCFCEGTDVTILHDTSGYDALMAAAAEFFHSLVDLQIPLIAAVDGPAIGVGFSMLLHFDVVVVSTESEMRCPFVQWGLVPEAASTLLLPRLTGITKAFELFCLGKALSPWEAREYGIATYVCNPADTELRACDIAVELSRLPRHSLGLTRRLLHQDDRAVERMKDELLAFKSALDNDITQRKISALSRIALALAKKKEKGAAA